MNGSIILFFSEGIDSKNLVIHISFGNKIPLQCCFVLFLFCYQKFITFSFFWKKVNKYIVQSAKSLQQMF